MTAEQLRWLDVVEIICTTDPEYQNVAPKSKCRVPMYNFVQHTWFDNSIGIVIILNTFVMASEYQTQPKAMDMFMEVANISFTAIFSIEAVLKIIGIGWVQFWMSRWNQFDLVIAIVSIFDIIILYIMSSFNGTSVVKVFRLGRVISRILRIARIGRTVRLAKSMKSLKVMMITLAKSVPYVAIAFNLYFLILFLYSVLGTSIFGKVKRGTYLHDRANFENFANSLLTLFRVSTGDTWNGLYHDLRISPPFCGTDPHGNAVDDCGSPIYARLFFVSFQVLMGLIMMNVLVSVFLENFDEIDTQSKYLINFDEMQVFQQCWSMHAPGTGLMMPVSKLAEFLKELPPPLGLGPPHIGTKIQLFKLIRHLYTPGHECKTGIAGVRCLVLTFRCLSLPCVDLSCLVSTFRCRLLPFTDPSLPFLGLSVPSLDIPLSVLCPSLTFHCFFTAFRCAA